MNHVIAVLCLAVACIVWFLVQRASGRTDEAECEEEEAHCDDCASRTDRCQFTAGLWRAIGNDPQPLSRLLVRKARGRKESIK